VIKTRRRFAFSLGLLFAALLAGCGGDIVLPNEGDAAELEIVSGNEQLAPAGTTLPQPVVVRVLDTRERPVANQDVTFTIGSGGGTVEPSTVKSDAAGQAAASWTLGPSSGTHMLRVQTPRGGSGMLEVTVRATAVAGSGSVLVEAGGNDQIGPVNSALADSLVVKATDALGNPVADVEVTWSVSGGGSISPTTVVTGADGLAAAERVLGPAASAQSAQATVDGFTGSPVTFSHTAVPANPTALVKISGDGQTAPGGFEVAEDLVVRLEDDNGNGIGERAITWVAPAGSGSVDPVNTTTDANGLATTRWTLPSAVGTHSVSAVFSGLPAVAFTGTATADVPTTIELVSGNNQSAAVGGTVPNPLVVRVTDANDNPVADVPVIWTANDGGTVSDATTATNTSGLAQVTRTLGLVPGAYTTTAAVDGLSGSPVTFTSTATVGPPARLAIVTQPGTPAQSGTALSPQPVIQVEDAAGNPVSQAGITVTATITSGPAGGTLANRNDNTNPSGLTTYTNLTITGPAGDYVLTFTSGALTAVGSETITLGAGTANRIVILAQPSATAASGAVFAQQPVVQVQDGSGNPILTAGLVIAASIQDGQPALGPSAIVNATTDGTGTASYAGLRITGVVGIRTLSFSRPGLVAVESNQINITAGPATSIAIEAGNNQSATVGTPVTTDPSVIVTDASDNPVSDVSVDFDVTPGSGSVSPGTVATGPDGIAAVNSWTLGTSVGSHTLTATSPGLQGSPITFTATATAATTTTLQSNNDPADEGEDVTFTATVDAVDSPSVPTGQVTFRNGGVSIGTGNLDGSGVATLTVNNLPVGAHDITAEYSATGNFGASTSNTVTQDIDAVNGAPTAQNDPATPGDYTVDQDGQLVVSSAIGVLANDTDPDGDNLTAQLVPGPDVQNGTLTLNDDDGSFTYTPEPGFSGTDTFEYEAFDGQATSNVATVTITVNPL
jgi:adhesin/invasin